MTDRRQHGECPCLIDARRTAELLALVGSAIEELTAHLQHEAAPRRSWRDFELPPEAPDGRSRA